ncbi:hypothetical protein QBC37DRAFT_455081 [Rhypophila decipiens]|uniref:Uncharacterized protein n=1 Tax=Rhypophila decipiens TaxID=261697 RepID=A0AAN6YD85_9PEZI|nr:hypothetical protein QBC37DRAFT_455081 [Rhypophila decipiens]
MSTAALPQLQVLLDNAHSFPAPTPPNSASTNPSESPDSAISKTETAKSPKRVVTLSSSPSAILSTGTSDHKPATRAGFKSPSPSPLDLIKPPPTPRPWLWQCHRCYTEYRVACTRRCFECGHEFCTAVNNSSKRGPCRSQFDFAAWEAWGSFRRTLAQLGRSGVFHLDVPNTDKGAGNKRRNKAGVHQDDQGNEQEKNTVGTAGAGKSTFATWTPATETIHDLRRGWVSSIVHTEGRNMPWQAVTAEERDAIMKKKEKMYVRREYNCWTDCDAPSECRLAVYTACFEGRARLIGNGKLTAVLLEYVNPKKGKRKTKREKKKATASKLTSKVEDSDDEKQETSDQDVDDNECVIMKKLRRKKNQLLYGGDGRTSERRPSTEIVTEHVEDRQAAYELPADSILKTETEREERTTGIPRQIVWPSSGATSINENSSSATDSTKPRGLLATLISGSDSEIDLGTLPLGTDHGEDAEDAEFAELVRVSSNLAQSTGNMTSSSSSATSLVSPPPTSFTIIRIDEADHHIPSAEPARKTGNHASSEARRDSAIFNPPPNHQSPQQTEGFVDLKEVISIGYLQERPKPTKKRQRSDHSQARTTSDYMYTPDEIFCPSPIKFKIPIWNDEQDDDENITGQMESLVSEYSAADLMDILSSESESCDSNASSESFSPATSSADDGQLGLTTTGMKQTARQPTISPEVSLTSASHDYYGSVFSPVSPLDPETKMNNDLSMYLDDEIMSPVSIAAARTLGSLHLADPDPNPTTTEVFEDNLNDEMPITPDQGNKHQGNSRNGNGKDKDNQCEVLLTLRKMQSAFMGGRQEGRLW